jgi:hypothetical protein
MCLRLIQPKHVFFYAEFWSLIPKNTHKRSFQSRMLTAIKEHAAEKKVAETPTQSIQVSVDEAVSGALTNNPLKVKLWRPACRTWVIVSNMK